jgi:capsular polysaccharide biosynthesis protein
MGLFIAMPTTYRSAAVIRVRGQDPKRKIAAIDAIKQDVESAAKLGEIVTNYGLYQNEPSKLPSEDVIQQMLKHITVTQAGPNFPAVLIRYDYNDRHIAQRVTEDLASRFLDEGKDLQGVSLQILDPASLPATPIYPNIPMVVGFGVVCFLLIWSALSAWRSNSLRRHAPAV